eukprot:CAMPEP_0168617822 /NCGR_PEP_ID=MMETSP0449_2-20121227/5747_1 /TAXON_ID=1082188 /ORGANISM="Strombidium rassoulzadegani, Strain ras09" /LENGTH=56 /DNA_ID=CAMNT_0008658663 /DNA_START=268 /DNA_END=435 /DNA_ORIENTATION=+
MEAHAEAPWLLCEEVGVVFNSGNLDSHRQEFLGQLLGYHFLKSMVEKFEGGPQEVW